MHLSHWTTFRHITPKRYATEEKCLRITRQTPRDRTFGNTPTAHGVVHDMCWLWNGVLCVSDPPWAHQLEHAVTDLSHSQIVNMPFRRTFSHICKQNLGDIGDVTLPKTRTICVFLKAVDFQFCWISIFASLLLRLIYGLLGLMPQNTHCQKFINFMEVQAFDSLWFEGTHDIV